jgi:MYXO-CTERM domain-containing protein
VVSGETSTFFETGDMALGLLDLRVLVVVSGLAWYFGHRRSGRWFEGALLSSFCGFHSVLFSKGVNMLLLRGRGLVLVCWTMLVCSTVVVGQQKQLAGPAGGSRQYLVVLEQGHDALDLGARLGLSFIGRSGVESSWVFFEDDGVGPVDQVLAQLGQQRGVVQVGRLSRAPQVRGFVPNDPYFFMLGGGYGNGAQWHLSNPHVPGRDVNVTPAWEREVTGAGVTIGIVDDSLEWSHPDLLPNYRADVSWDFGEGDSDPSPVWTSDGHGVSVAGLAAARGGNGLGVTGAAPHASLAGLRIDFFNQTEQMFIDATLYRNDAIRVKNHSYGIPVDYVPSSGQVLANQVAASAGVINVRAAGNESWNANAKAAQADPTALTVAALGIDGRATYYSNFGANVFVTAPSSDEAGMPLITTTDRTGVWGYNDGTNPVFTDSSYTNVFGGTSASAPIVSGVVAQMLQVNPNLDIYEVKQILAQTSRKVDADDPNWLTNGAGYEFNPRYGFGLVDADAATQMAASYVEPERITLDTGMVEVGQVVPDDDATGVVVTFDVVADPGAALETVELNIEATHTFPGDLEIVLTSPSGTASTLGYAFSFAWEEDLNWMFSSAAYWGEDPTGEWSVWMADLWEQDEGMFDALAFRATATVPEPGVWAVGLMAVLWGGSRRRRRDAALALR